MSDKIIQSYVFKDGQAWFVSTIERDYDTYEGRVRGPETIAWDWNPTTRKRGDSIVYCNSGRYANAKQECEGLDEHFRVCSSLHKHGVAYTHADLLEAKAKAIETITDSDLE